MATKRAQNSRANNQGKSKPKAKPLTNSKNDVKTGQKKDKSHLMNPSTGRKFSKDYQPSGEAKSAGKRRAKTLREFLSMPLRKGKMAEEYEEFLKECISVYGVSKEDIDIRLFMEMRMTSMALKGDVQAYKALLDRAIGKPREEQAPIIDTPETRETNTIQLPGGAIISI